MISRLQLDKYGVIVHAGLFSPPFPQGAVLHEVSDLATDAAAAVIRSHFSLCEDFRVKEILLRYTEAETEEGHVSSKSTFTATMQTQARHHRPSGSGTREERLSLECQTLFCH